MADDLIVALQRAERVAGPGAGVVRDLVVARPGDVDRGGAPDDVERRHIGRHVAHEHGAGRPQQGIPFVQPIHPRLHIPHPRLGVLENLQDGVPEHQHDGAHEEVGVDGQQIDVARAPLLLLGCTGAQSRHRQSCLFGVAIEHVVDARPAAHQAIALGIARVDLRRVAARDKQLLPILVVPAEGRDVEVVAEHDPGLAGRCLRGEAAVHPRQHVAFLVPHLLEGRQHVLGQRLLHVVEAEAIDLQHHQAAAGLGSALEDVALGQPLHHPVVEGILIIDAQHARDHGVDGRQDEAAQESRQEAVDLQRRHQPRDDEQSERIGKEPDDDGDQDPERQRQQQDQRPEQQVDDAQREGSRSRSNDIGSQVRDLEAHAGQDPGRDDQCDGIHEPQHEKPDEPPDNIADSVQGSTPRSRAACMGYSGFTAEIQPSVTVAMF